MLNVFLSTDNPACTGLDVNLFYPTSGDDESTEAQALMPILHKICSNCDVIDKCRKWAIVHEEFGFWGGMSAGERRLYRRRHNIKLDRPWKSEYLKGMRNG
jgi:hypothetical protein